MRNQPMLEWQAAKPGLTPEQRLHQWRFSASVVLFVLVAAVIVARIVWVQTILRPRYLNALQATTVEYEVIPARDGRILTESLTLAEDIPVYGVEVHYRWIEERVNEDWLKRRIRESVRPADRGEDEYVAVRRDEILSDRRRFWEEISRIADVTQASLQARRGSIESRVQRIIEDVNRRRSRRRSSDSAAGEVAEGAAGGFWSWLGEWRRELTTAPDRTGGGRLVVREEEDYHEILELTDQRQAAAFRSLPLLEDGLRVVERSRRNYPHPLLASHVIGARTRLPDEERDRWLKAQGLETSRWLPRRGRTGVEQSAQKILGGTPGLRRIIRDRRFRVLQEEILRPSEPGADVVLTIHPELQQATNELLAEALGDGPGRRLDSEQNDAVPTPRRLPLGGALLVMDVNTGEIAAAASAPVYSLDLFTTAGQEEWEVSRTDRRRPFINRVVTMALPPGSVFKVVTAAAALDYGIMARDQLFDCRGYLDDPDSWRCLIYRRYGTNHGPIRLREALAQSCNVYFFHAGEQLGLPRLRQWAQRFRLDDRTGIDLPFERSGRLPLPENGLPDSGAADVGIESVLTMALRNDGGMSDEDRRRALGMSVGQSRLTLTPIQMATVYASLVNGGDLVTPHVIRRDGQAQYADRNAEAEAEPPPLRSLSRTPVPGLTEEIRAAIFEGLQDAVEDERGTAFRTVRMPEISIAGKTGSAESRATQEDHAWFIGCVPADKPRYVVVTVLEHGGSGSRAAGPVAREIIRDMLRLDLLNQKAGAEF